MKAHGKCFPFSSEIMIFIVERVVQHCCFCFPYFLGVKRSLRYIRTYIKKPQHRYCIFMYKLTLTLLYSVPLVPVLCVFYSCFFPAYATSNKREIDISIKPNKHFAVNRSNMHIYHTRAKKDEMLKFSYIFHAS